MNLRTKKFVPIPKHAFDISAQRQMAQAINAVLNSRVVYGQTSKFHHSDSNMVLELPAPPVVQEFYPFKIYKPDIKDLALYGYMLGSDLSSTFTAIDPNTPTNLPTTINPNTDGWRIWAVRDGLVGFRPFDSIDFGSENVDLSLPGETSVVIPLSGWAETFLVSHHTDGFCDGQGINYNDPINRNTNPVVPIILGGDPDTTGGYNFSIWLEVQNGNIVQSAWVTGKQYDPLTEPNPFPLPDDPSLSAVGTEWVVPLGIISSYSQNNPKLKPKDLTVYQIQLGHAIPQFGFFQNNYGNSNPSQPALEFCATINYRGDFINDRGLADLAFYPGDVVKIQRQIDLTATSSGGIVTTVTLSDASGDEGSSSSIFTQSLYMMTSIAGPSFTDDPTTDPDWVKVSGLDLVAQANTTPNT